MVQQQPDGDQGRQGIADYLHPNGAIQALRQGREFDRQTRDLLPGDEARQGAVHQDRHGKRAVIAIGGADCRDPLGGCRAGIARDVGLCLCQRAASPACLGGNGQCREGQQRGRQVAGAIGGVAPSPVGVLCLGEPVDAVGDKGLIFARSGKGEGAERRRSGEWGRGQAALPVSLGQALLQEALAGGPEGVVQALWRDHCAALRV